MQINSLTFKGYDVMPLKGLYMQGLRSSGEQHIFKEMKQIAEKEGIELWINNGNKEISHNISTLRDPQLSIWGQDNKAFVLNQYGQQILWNLKETLLPQSETSKLGIYNINQNKYMPRGGNYYLGQNNNNEKWLIINAQAIEDEGLSEGLLGEELNKHLSKLFGVDDRNIIPLYGILDDLDENIRPIGFPYVLINNYNESLKILEEMKENFPLANESYNELKQYITHKIKEQNILNNNEEIITTLKRYGFVPIEIGGRFSDDINYMNAIALKNKQGKVSYITNSAKFSYPELEYLEEIFNKTLKAKVPQINHTYFVSGGERRILNPDSLRELYAKGLTNRNTIMDILANRLGGIHCMTAEIPNFDQLG